MSVDKERVSVTFTKVQVHGLDRVVREGVYLDRGSAVREAVKRLLGDHGVHPFYAGALLPEEVSG